MQIYKIYIEADGGRDNFFFSFNNINVWDTEHVGQILSLSALVYSLLLEMEMVFVGLHAVSKKAGFNLSKEMFCTP